MKEKKNRVHGKRETEKMEEKKKSKCVFTMNKR